MKYFVSAYIIIASLSCNDSNLSNDHRDHILLKEQINALQNRMDSLIQALNKKEALPLKSKQKKKARSNSETKNDYSSSTKTSSDNNTANNNLKNTETNTTPAYKQKKETQTYKVRVGAICCDGSRSYATGRGACSHHGGVCKWLYQ